MFTSESKSPPFISSFQLSVLATFCFVLFLLVIRGVVVTVIAAAATAVAVVVVVYRPRSDVSNAAAAADTDFLPKPMRHVDLVIVRCFLHLCVTVSESRDEKNI